MTRGSFSLVFLVLASPAVAFGSSFTMAAEQLAGARVALAENAPGRAFELARLARGSDPNRSVEAWELMGRARAEMGDWGAAHRLFRRALAVANPRERTRLLAQMQLARDELGVVRVDLQPGGAILFVDGAPAEYEAGERVLLLRPGSRRLEARLEGHRPRVETLRVSAGEVYERHIALERGAEDLSQPIPRPRHEAAGRRWLTGNAILIGVGTLSMAAAASPRAPTLAEGSSFQLGLSSGLALGSALNMILQQAFDVDGRGSLTWARLIATPLILAAAVAAVSVLWAPRPCEVEGSVCPADRGEAAGTVGALAGVAISTMANVVLGDANLRIATSLGVAFSMLGLVEGLFAWESSARAEELRSAAQSQASEDHETMAAVTGGLSIAFLALAAASFTLGFVGGDDDLDLSVAAGPGTLTVRGTF